MHPSTQLVRFDPSPNDPWRANSTPIYQTATFAQEFATEFGAYDYTRSGNPTRAVLETQLAKLERGERAFAFTSGMAALSTLLRLVPNGGHILAGDDLYGGTYRLLEKVAPRQGIRASYVDLCDLELVERSFTDKTRFLLVETPTNPLQRIADLRALSTIARAHGALLVVDNSFLSPWLQQPLVLGADIVVHSATKHLCGHGDVMAGALVVREKTLAEEIAFLQNAEGAALAPFDCFLLLRGMKTLGVRLDRAQESAGRVAEFLANHPRVKHVHYAGLDSHPGRKLHFSQARGAGSLVSFETGDAELSKQIVERAKLFTISVSFGSVTSQISLPCQMSHKSIPSSVRAAHVLPDDLVRISVGLEDLEDLIADLSAALASASAGYQSPTTLAILPSGASESTLMPLPAGLPLASLAVHSTSAVP